MRFRRGRSPRLMTQPQAKSREGTLLAFSLGQRLNDRADPSPLGLGIRLLGSRLGVIEVDARTAPICPGADQQKVALGFGACDRTGSVRTTPPSQACGLDA